MSDFPWTLGETNRFIVTATVQSNKTAYAGYLWRPQVHSSNHLALIKGQMPSPAASFLLSRPMPLLPTVSPLSVSNPPPPAPVASPHSNGSWTHLVTFRTRTGGQSLKGLYSFVGDFRRDYQSVQVVRRARYFNGWVRIPSGQWKALAQARFTASGAEWESKENIDAGIIGQQFYLATGGPVKMSRPLRTLIDLPSPPASPPIDLPSPPLTRQASPSGQ